MRRTMLQCRTLDNPQQIIASKDWTRHPQKRAVPLSEQIQETLFKRIMHTFSIRFRCGGTKLLVPLLINKVMLRFLNRNLYKGHLDKKIVTARLSPVPDRVLL